MGLVRRGGKRAGQNSWVEGKSEACGVRGWCAPLSIVVASVPVSVGSATAGLMMKLRPPKRLLVFFSAVTYRNLDRYGALITEHSTGGSQVARFFFVQIHAQNIFRVP